MSSYFSKQWYQYRRQRYVTAITSILAHNQNQKKVFGCQFSRFKIFCLFLLCSSTRGRYSYRNSSIWGREIYLKATLLNSSSKFDLYICCNVQLFTQGDMIYETPLCDHTYSTAFNLTPLISVSLTTHFPATLSPWCSLRILYSG